MGDLIELGAQLKELSVVDQESAVVATYELIDRHETALGGGGSIRISFAALDAIHKHLGGTDELTAAERIDMVFRFIRPLFRPLFVAGFTRVGAAPPERQDVVVHAHGEIVDQRNTSPAGV